MSDDISISVTIGGRKYPLTVAVKDQELIQSIANDLNNTVSSLKENYAVQDRQDLLAMAALQVAVKQAIANRNTGGTDSSDTGITNDLEKLVAKSDSLV